MKTTIVQRAALLCGVVLFAVGCDSGGSATTAHATSSSPVVEASSPASSPASPKAPLGLAVVALDGTVRKDLRLPTDAWMADLSADGSWLAFLTESPEVGFCGGCGPNTDRLAVLAFGKPAGAFLYPSGGDHVRTITEPALSPDGSEIAFVGTGSDGKNRDIYVATLRSAGLAVAMEARVLRLTDDPAMDEFPAWSPDGSTIFYDNGGAEPLDDSGFSSTQEIWSVPADGGAPQRLTHNSDADVQPDVSAGGTVVFWHEGEIWTMEQEGRNQQRLAAVPSDSGFNPRWSPDGTMVALLRYDASERASFDEHLPLRPGDLPLMQVVVVKLATGHVITVGPRVASDVNPVSWMPDGSALVIDRYDAGA
jgi:Tol biopolymer transport system component